MGAAKDTITSTRARGESFSSRSTSQPLVIICMFIAMNDMKDPIQIQRKSRICNVSNMGDARTEFMPLLRTRLATGTVTFDGGGGAVTAGALATFWAKSFCPCVYE